MTHLGDVDDMREKPPLICYMEEKVSFSVSSNKDLSSEKLSTLGG